MTKFVATWVFYILSSYVPEGFIGGTFIASMLILWYSFEGAMDVDQPITSTSKKQFKGRRKQGKSKLAVIFKGTKGPKKVGKRFKK